MPNIPVGNITLKKENNYIWIQGVGTSFTYVPELNRGVRAGDVLLVTTAVNSFPYEIINVVKDDLLTAAFRTDRSPVLITNPTPAEILDIVEFGVVISSFYEEKYKTFQEERDFLNEGLIGFGLPDIVNRLDDVANTDQEFPGRVTVSIGSTVDQFKKLKVTGTGTTFNSASSGVGRALAPGDRIAFKYKWAPDFSLPIESVNGDDELILEGVQAAESFIIEEPCNYTLSVSATGLRSNTLSEIKTEFGDYLSKALGTIFDALKDVQSQIYNSDCIDYDNMFEFTKRILKTAVNNNPDARNYVFKKSSSYMDDKIKNAIQNLDNSKQIVDNVTPPLDLPSLDITDGINLASDSIEKIKDVAINATGFDPDKVKSLSSDPAAEIITNLLNNNKKQNSTGLFDRVPVNFSSAFIKPDGTLTCNPIKDLNDALLDLIPNDNSPNLPTYPDAKNLTEIKQTVLDMKSFDTLSNLVTNDLDDIINTIYNLKNFTDSETGTPNVYDSRDISLNLLSTVESAESIIKSAKDKIASNSSFTDKYHGLSDMMDSLKSIFLSTISAKRAMQVAFNTDTNPLNNVGNYASDLSNIGSIKSLLTSFDLKDLTNKTEELKRVFEKLKGAVFQKLTGKNFNNPTFGANLNTEVTGAINNVKTLLSGLKTSVDPFRNALGAANFPQVDNVFGILKGGKFDIARETLLQGNLAAFNNLSANTGSSLGGIIDNLSELMQNSDTLSQRFAINNILEYYLSEKDKIEHSNLFMNCGLEKDARIDINRNELKAKTFEESTRNLDGILKELILLKTRV